MFQIAEPPPNLERPRLSFSMTGIKGEIVVSRKDPHQDDGRRGRFGLDQAHNRFRGLA